MNNYHYLISTIHNIVVDKRMMTNCVRMLRQCQYLLLIIVLGLILPLSGCGRTSDKATSSKQGTAAVEAKEKQDVSESIGERKYTSKGTPYVDSEGLKIFDSIEMIPVESSALEAIGYSEEFEVLAVEFDNGGIYLYYDVSENVFKDFLNAKSRGGFFNSEVKGQYDCERVE